MTTTAPTPGPNAPPPRCWAGPARALLAIVAVPLAARFAAAVLREPPPPRAWPALAVDANSAPVGVLEALPGMGPALAGRVVAARRETPFRDLDDLDRRVKGIGPAKAAALRPFLRFPVRPALSSQPGQG